MSLVVFIEDWSAHLALAKWLQALFFCPAQTKETPEKKDLILGKRAETFLIIMIYMEVLTLQCQYRAVGQHVPGKLSQKSSLVASLWKDMFIVQMVKYSILCLPLLKIIHILYIPKNLKETVFASVFLTYFTMEIF